MKTFLQYIAQDIISKYGTNLSRIAVVFPNKRASLFLNEELARLADKPLWSPSYITISDLFRRHSKLQAGDPIKLICDLHKVFCSCTGSSESLDEFYGWGQLLIADFDDIDKNMADADKVFANLKDIHELDDVTYLTDEQKEMLQKFFSNFSEEHNTKLKERFLSLWSHFDDIYHQFNTRLIEQGIAYEGALYRKVVENADIEFNFDTYLFVGFNMMQKVELSLCDRLQKQGKAKFYWDYDDYYMQTEAGTYIRQYLAHYPNELDNTNSNIYHNFTRPKQVTYISAATENIQARYVSEWLKANNRIEAGRRTAVVMADEALLNTVIHSLPEEVTKVNVTTGYPLAQTPVSSFVETLIQLQTIGHPKDTDRFRLHQVNAILRHPYARYISDNCKEVYDNINIVSKRYYPSMKDLAGEDENLALLFSDLSAETQYLHTKRLVTWLCDVLQCTGHHAKNDKDALFQESLFRMYTLLNRLAGLMDTGDLEIDIQTFTRLLTQLIQSTTIPFHGEPAVGIQVMGVLETRNLDFDHVLILSCNEGNLPKGVNDSSFIPYSIRKAYGLTTVDNKVAIYAYYFHSLLQRAGDVTLIYNNSTEDGHTGEMSRFMLQMLVESPFLIKQKSLRAGQIPISTHREAIPKDEIVLNKLQQINTLSPSAINQYLFCQLRFYYRYIAGISEPDENDEDQIDNRIFGNIFHHASELFYNQFGKGAVIQQGDIDEYLKRPELLGKLVDEAFREDLFNIKDPHGYLPEYNGLQIINREVILNYLLQLLRLDRELTPFTILGTEIGVYMDTQIKISTGQRSLRIGGLIDRLDSINTMPEGERIRVVDYKTGVLPSRKVSSIEDIFGTEFIHQMHSDYYLQSFLYSYIIRHNLKYNADNLPVSPALLFIQHTGGKDYDPTLMIGKEKVIDIDTYADEYSKKLHEVLTDIFEPVLSFEPTEHKDRCTLCPYNKLCGK